MYFDLKDSRKPLSKGSRIVLESENGDNHRKYIIDAFVGAGGFSLMYIAHDEVDQHFVALKELFPRSFEDCTVERRDDDKIVIYNPFTESSEADDSERWKDVLPYFQREVTMTRRAGTVYSSTGEKISQNNPDVFGIYGPFVSANGNHYLAIDTKNGISLENFISGGWESKADRGIYRNGRLENIFKILLRIAKHLSALHGDHRMLHLDISPANIYVSYTNGGTELEPMIIDYGSAFDLDDPNEALTHRFTVNPFSAPEVEALAAINMDDDYKADVTSDTYSVTAILFYSVLGRIYEPQMVYDGSWVKAVVDLYPEPIYHDFANELISFFRIGLSSDQAERYVTNRPANDSGRELLYDALDRLSSIYGKASAGILSAVLIDGGSRDEIMSYALLDKYPLFRYYGEDGNIHVLCCGSGMFVNMMVHAVMSTGQMTGHKLFIHIVSADAEHYKDVLFAQCPALSQYASYEGHTVSPELEYINFTFDTVDDITDEKTCRRIIDEYGKLSRYVVISLGANSSNITLAKRLAAGFGNAAKSKAIVSYYAVEDSAKNIRSDEGINIPKNVSVIPFGEDVPSFGKEIRDLGQRAFKVSFMYDRISDKSASKKKVMKRFVNDRYGARSSLAAAVHLDYKLESIGIRVNDPRISHRSASEYKKKVIDQYTACLGDRTKYGLLLELEHRRWMMYMIADSYVKAEKQDIEKYAFRMVGSRFNGAFKCSYNGIRIHHCLVPCDTNGISLPRNHAEWDKYGSEEEIKNAPYDELDRMSLYAHYVAGGRIRRPSTVGRIKNIIDNNIDEIVDINIAAEDTELKQAYEDFKEYISQILEHTAPLKLTDRFEEMRHLFERRGIDADQALNDLENELAIFAEYYKYRDYKVGDTSIIDNLLWIRFGSGVSMIKCTSDSVAANVSAPLILMPETLVYIGKAVGKELRDLFAEHGDNIEVISDACVFDDIDAVCKKLRTYIVASPKKQYVIDVTGADPVFTAAAVKIALENDGTGVVFYDIGSNEIKKVVGFPDAPIYRPDISLSAEDIFELYGAKEKKESGNYMERLGTDADKLWQFYEANAERWEMISSFFSKVVGGWSELYVKIPLSGWEQWFTFSYHMPTGLYNDAGIEEVMRSLEAAGIIKNLSSEITELYMTLRFDYPYIETESRKNVLYARFSTLFNNLGSAKLRCNIIKNKDDTVTIDIATRLHVSINRNNVWTDKDNDHEKQFATDDMVEPLRELERLKLIHFLIIKPTKTAVEDKYFIQFTYNSSAVRECLMKAGNVLEMYVWRAAEQTGYFDSVEANYSFSWSNPAVSNELDVVLTKSLTTLFCSCKTGSLKKEHLYEISALARRFSVNTKPVIVYSSDKVYDGVRLTTVTDAVRERANEMGVYLIGPEKLDNIGEELKKIACGKMNDSHNQSQCIDLCE